MTMRRKKKKCSATTRVEQVVVAHHTLALGPRRCNKFIVVGSLRREKGEKMISFSLGDAKRYFAIG